MPSATGPSLHSARSSISVVRTAPPRVSGVCPGSSEVTLTPGGPSAPVLVAPSQSSTAASMPHIPTSAGRWRRATTGWKTTPTRRTRAGTARTSRERLRQFATGTASSEWHRTRGYYRCGCSTGTAPGRRATVSRHSTGPARRASAWSMPASAAWGSARANTRRSQSTPTRSSWWPPVTRARTTTIRAPLSTRAHTPFTTFSASAHRTTTRRGRTSPTSGRRQSTSTPLASTSHRPCSASTGVPPGPRWRRRTWPRPPRCLQLGTRHSRRSS